MDFWNSSKKDDVLNAEANWIWKQILFQK